MAKKAETPAKTGDQKPAEQYTTKDVVITMKRNARAIRQLSDMKGTSSHITAAIAEMEERQEKLRGAAHKLLDSEIDAALSKITETGEKE